MIEIGGLQKLTLIDFPGCLAATVFLIGCNFRCPFCYASELVLSQKIKNQPRITEKEFFNFLKERKGLLEGVVICGGEPTIYEEDLPEFCQEIKKLGYVVKLDTNGSSPNLLESLIDQKLIDYVAMDVKAPRKKYPKAIGLENSRFKPLIKKAIENIERSMEILKEEKIDFEFRTTVVPNLLKKKDILKIARWISPAKKYFLQNFRPERTVESKFEKIKPYPQEYLLEIQKAISPFFEICQVR